MASTDRYKYAREKLQQAARILATGRGDVRSRLRRTYRHLRVLRADDVPNDSKGDLQWVKSAMVRYGPKVDQHGPLFDALEHTMRRIRNGTGQKIAERICLMHSKLPKR